MEKQIILNLGDGNFQQGFDKTSIKIQGKSNEEQINFKAFSCHLAPIPELPDVYKRWQEIYRAQAMFPRGRIHKEAAGAVNVNEYIETCDQALSSLQTNLDRWLDSTKHQLEEVLDPDPQDEIRIIVQTHRICSVAVKDVLHRLPWHLWNLLPEEYLTESAISSSDLEHRSQVSSRFNQNLNPKRCLKRVKILCILGESREQIDVEEDRRLFRKIPGAYCVFLRQPQRSELQAYLNERWDILFFAGHSATQKYEEGQTGLLQINSKEFLDIQEIKLALDEAIGRGLKLAIFNSCDGLGIAHQISDLDIAQVIVWREPVPDRVAQEFLNSFIKFFTESSSLYHAVKEARLALQVNGRQWPKVSWLPIIYQNLAREAITWHQLRECSDSKGLAEQEKGKSKSPRRLLLQKVEKAWIDGVLNEALHIESITLELGLEERLDFVSQSQVTRTLPEGTRAIDIFGELNNKRTLLILGEPGSGKTIALLEIAREAISDVQKLDSTLPIPVVLNLSSWGGEEKVIPLDQWLIQELNRIYQFSKPQCERWVENQQLLLLLDGLDEVSKTKRDACVRVINQFLRTYKSTEMVVCSRTEDYESLSEKLHFQSAVLYKPLTTEQIEQYLGDAKKELLGVRDLWFEDPVLQSLINSPLILNIAAVAYRGKSKQELKKSGTREERQADLLKSYIKKRLEEVSAKKEKKIIFRLHWLAKMLIDKSQNMLLIEQIQPDWLFSERQKWFYVIGVRLLLGLIIGLIGVLHFGTQVTDNLGSQAQLVIPSVAAGMISSISVLLLSKLLIRLVPNSRTRNRPPTLPLFISGIVSGVIYVFIAAQWSYAVVGTSIDSTEPWRRLLSPLIIDGVVLGFFLFLSLLSQRIELIDTIKRSWLKAWKYSFIGLFGGALYALIRLIFTNAYGIKLLGGESFGWLNFKYHEILIELIIFSILPGLIGLLDKGENLEQTVEPNQGIWRSTKNSLRFFSLFFPIGMVFSLPYIDAAHEVISIGLAVGLLAGLVGGRGPVFAGVVLVQHFVLRVLLWWQRCTPWNYARFLDDAKNRILLRKTGGGYIFIHRVLMEHFAKIRAE